VQGYNFKCGIIYRSSILRSSLHCVRGCFLALLLQVCPQATATTRQEGQEDLQRKQAQEIQEAQESGVLQETQEEWQEGW